MDIVLFFGVHAYDYDSYLRNAVHFKSKNELRHLFEVNTIDHTDDVRPVQ